MRIEYEITERDFINGQRLAIKNSPVRLVRWTRLVLPFFGIALLAFWIQGVVQQGFSWDVIPVLAIPLFFISIPLVSRNTQKKLYAQTNSMHGPLSLEIDDVGLEFKGPTFTSKIEWPHFRKFFEDDQSFVIYADSGVFNVIPKRGLSSEQITDLREYFARKLSK